MITKECNDYCIKKPSSEEKGGFYYQFCLILILVPKEIILRGIVGPNILNALVDIALIFNLLQILKHLSRGT